MSLPPEPEPGGDEGPGPDEGPLSFQGPSAEEQRRRWAHRQDPDLDSDEASPGDQAPPPPRPRNPYSWLFALIVGVLLVYITLNTFANRGAVTRGVEPGGRLPPFAAPIALSRLDGDANVADAAGQGQRGNRPACRVRGPSILNSCQLTEGAPAVLAFVATAEPACAAQLDRLERARRRFSEVRFAAVAARTDRARLRGLIRRRGWGFPVAYDRDGAVFARYGVVDCPTMTFAYPGGKAMATTVKALSDVQLTARLTRLREGARRRGWKPPAR